MTKAANMTPEQEVKLKTATTWIPIGLMVSIVAAFSMGTWALSNERATIYGKINQVSADVKSLSDTVKQLTEVMGRPNTGGMSKQQLVIDCLRTQIANPNWKCIYANPMPEWITSYEMGSRP